MCGAMADSDLNVDPSKFLASGFSEEDMEKSMKTVISGCADPVLVRMLMAGAHADITFEVLRGPGASVLAHKCVLVTISSEFAYMFDHRTEDRLSSTVETYFSIDALQLFLLLIYISSEERMNHAMLELREAVDRHFRELYEAANTYDVMKRLNAVFADALPRILSPENCLSPYGLTVKDICQQYILRNFKEVSASKTVLEVMDRHPKLVQSFMNLAASPRACDKCGWTPVKKESE